MRVGTGTLHVVCVHQLEMCVCVCVIRARLGWYAAFLLGLQRIGPIEYLRSSMRLSAVALLGEPFSPHLNKPIHIYRSS